MTLTFAGYPEGQNGSVSDIAIVGAPVDLGATGQPGQRFAPESIRIASSEVDHEHFVDPRGYDYATASVRDWGDIPISMGDYRQSLVEVEEALEDIATRCHRLILLGGDDGVNAPLASSLMTRTGHVATAVILHLDAHTDTYEQTSKGRRDHGTWITDLIMDGITQEVHQFGVRALAPSYKRQKKTLKHVTRHSEHYDSISPIQSTLEELIAVARDAQKRDEPVLLAIDMDVVDPAYAPGVAFPEPGGFSSREMRYLVRNMAQHVSAMSITEVTPAYDQLGLTSQLASRLVLDFIFGYGTAQRVTSDT